MIEVMNFFQAMFIVKSTKPVVSLNTAEVKLAVALKGEALELKSIAEREIQNGAAAQTLFFEAKNRANRRAFAEIAVWHYKRAAEKFDKAADRFDEAGRIHTKKIQAFRSKAQEMRRHAGKASVAVEALNNYLIQKSAIKQN